ncbi:MAG: DUF4129 domain-containing protein, partial [Actinomycetes bacterium]
VDRGQLPDIAGRTTGELRHDLSFTTPTAAGAFDRATTIFELAWYAELPVDASDVADLRDAAAQVLAADHHQRSRDDHEVPVPVGALGTP